MIAYLLRARGAAAWVKRWAASSAWAPLAGHAAGYLLAFVLLALVGSGHLARWLTPAPRLAIGVAEAATAQPTASGAIPEAPSATAGAEAASAAPGAGAAPGAPEAEVAHVEADAGAASMEDAGASKGVASDGKIILNLASEQDLRRLHGVGRAKARAILALRAQMGKFTRVEDLLKVKGIGKRALARLKPQLRVD